MANAHAVWLGNYSLGRAPAEARWQAAAEAGFPAMSIWWGEVRNWLAGGHDVGQFRERFYGSGLVPAQLEFVSLPARPSPEFRDEAQTAAEAAAELGCVAVHAVALGREFGSGAIEAAFGLLCDSCAAQNLPCGVEFIPYLSPVASLAEAAALLAAVRRPNAGVVVDTLHFFRSGADWAGLSALRPEQIVSVQVSDASADLAAAADYGIEARSGRLLPGEGELALGRFVAAIRDTRPDLSLTIEVASAALDALPPTLAAAAMWRAARSLTAARTKRSR
jgi:sugar phosphate isomerase/epimerase